MRIHKMKRIREAHEARERRERSARVIQSAYRGYQGRVLVKMMIFQNRKKRAKEYTAATIINCRMRIVICKALLREMKKERFEKWVADAKLWQETWEEESEMWFFLHRDTGESTWEPAKTGYTKVDGRLVLMNGTIINDPTQAGKKIRYNIVGDPIEDDDDTAVEAEQPQLTKAQLSKLCSECQDRVAIRNCQECGDKFCTICYKKQHKLGSRRHHTYTPCGPIDCSECESCLADRYCVSCDESFCDEHWRKVHSKGKRLFHAYSDISEEGVIDSRVYTMDGKEVEEYNPMAVQERLETEQASMPQYEGQYEGEEGIYALENGEDYSLTAHIENGEVESEWTSYFDDNGYEYWYNNTTGESSYEYPGG